MDIIDEIIQDLETEDVPVEFISAAKVVHFDGSTQIVKKDDFAAIMRNPEMYQVSQVRVVLNIKKLRKAISEEIKYCNELINLKLNWTENDGPKSKND